MPRRQPLPLPQTDSESDLSPAPTSRRSRQRGGRGDGRSQRRNMLESSQAKAPLGAPKQPQRDGPDGSDGTLSDSGDDAERQQDSDGLSDEEKGLSSGKKGSRSATVTGKKPAIVDGTWTTYLVSFALLVFWAAVGFVCYELYLHLSDEWYMWSLVWFAVSSPSTSLPSSLPMTCLPHALNLRARCRNYDLMYGPQRYESHDGLPLSIAWMDIVESALNFVVIGLAWAGKEGNMLLLGLIAATCTFWKTTLYFSVDVCSGFQTTKQDTRFQYWVIYVFPNIFWIVLPGAIIVQYAYKLWHILDQCS
ncbi:hypothetical protein JCM1840_000495 [Sporobolomyces johnsonii]